MGGGGVSLSTFTGSCGVAGGAGSCGGGSFGGSDGVTSGGTGALSASEGVVSGAAFSVWSSVCGGSSVTVPFGVVASGTVLSGFCNGVAFPSDTLPSDVTVSFGVSLCVSLN